VGEADSSSRLAPKGRSLCSDKGRKAAVGDQTPLARTDDGNDMHPEIFRTLHGSAADTSKRPADGLPRLSVSRQLSELITRQHDERNRRSIDQVQAVW
jgi:hypothetical protein